MTADDPLDELAGSVSDGSPVNWDQVETKGKHEAELQALREVARIADFNRNLQRTPPRGANPSPPTGGGPRSQNWGHLTLLERIGAGSNGEVWRAWDSTLEREVALKFLQMGNVDSSRATIAALLDEARALARVRHRGVVTVHGIAEYEGRPGLWMEFLRGPTLAEEIERRGALPVSEVVRLGTELCAALEAVDRASLVHRDIKPANVVLESDGRVVLTDFGLGWRAGAGGKAPLRSGTPIFMSPEVLAGEAPSHRSDIYALALTLRWALAGQSPFRARTFRELVEEARRGPVSALSSERPDAPRALTQAIDSAMAPDAASRLASAAKLAALMQAAMGIESSVASVAVLPFVNRSRDPDDEYFSDGLADEILNMLAKIRGLRVAARTSSFQFRDTRDDQATIGRRLNVAALLEGSVRLSGTRVRISVRLLKVADGFDLWSETYDRPLDDTFAVQDEIAESVVRELRTALLGEEPEKAAGDLKAEVALATRGRSANPEANQLCMHGRYFMERGTREDAVKANGYFKKALELDPGYALAWVHLGRAHMREADMGWIPPEEGHGQGRPMVERALSLEPDLPEGHAALGWTRMVSDWDWRGADASFHRALELMPGNTVVLSYAGSMASNFGRFDEAIELYRRAVELDPLSSLHYYALGLAFYRAGRNAEAEEFFRRGIELSPKRVVVRAHLALALLSQGRADEALAEATKEPEWWARLSALAIIHDASGRPKEADEALRDLIESGAETAAYQIAAVYAMRREPDSAFEWLERAFQLRDTGLAEMTSNPRLRSLHGDPRWAAFLSKMRFE